MKITIEGDAPYTVKDALRRVGVSTLLLKRLKNDPVGILVNGEHATVRRILSPGDQLELNISDSFADVSDTLLPTEMPLDILFEDDSIIAVNKPAGVPTHPTHGHFTDTLANGLKFYFNSKGIPFIFRAINRLDRDTSGIVLVAKHQLAASEYGAYMQSGRIHKTYTALLNGSPEPPVGIIERPIRRAHETIILREVCDLNAPGAKYARTDYSLLAHYGALSVVRCEPVTGRTHQLRVHFASLGAPIVGDGLYGSAETSPTIYDKLISRHALHAGRVVIERRSGTLELEAKLPSDMQRVIDAAKEKV